MNSSAITVISFDGDDTLWDFEKVMRHSLRHALAELQRHILNESAHRLTIDQMIAIRNTVAQELKGTVTNLETIRLQSFRRTLQRIGIINEELAQHLNKTYLYHRFEDIELYSDVIPTLDALAHRFKLGLLSNGNSYPERCGLAGRFSFVVFSQDYRVEKPDPKIFEIALSEAGCSAAELLHVGDSLVKDVAGAKRVGINSVWLNRAKQPNNSDIQPDVEITSLAELIPLLGCLKLQRGRLGEPS